jgi:tetratricopeptide (TPR) repeat protein
MRGHGSAVRRAHGCLVGVCLALVIALGHIARAAEDAQARVQAGIVALHHFEYEDANEAFRQAQALDPAFVLAYWGEALTYDQPLWRREDVDAARRALARLAPTPAARAAKARTARERGLLGAVDLLFGDGDRPSRQARYRAAMARLHEALPDDNDVAALYALALMSGASRGLIGFSDTHAADSHGLAGSETQREVAAIVDGVLRRDPKHPGALHYLLHDYDDPEHARLAVDAARTYASVAGGSSHALHMPAHIFLQLGLWKEAAASDRAAFDASTAWVQRKGLNAAMRNYHALEWLSYELLQLGRYGEAWAMLGEIEPVVRASGALTPGAPAGAAQPLLSDLSSMRARFAVETRRWDLLAHERNFGNADELCAIGLSAARRNNLDLARIARRALGERARSAQEGDLRPAIAIMEQQVAALIALAEGQRDDAISRLRTASQAEVALPAPLGLPQPIKPAPELLGDVLFELGQPRLAIGPFEAALRRNANRSLSMLGLARARAAVGEADAARKAYRELLASYENADRDLPEVQEARAALARPAESSATLRAGPGWMLWALALAIVLVVTVLAWRTRNTTKINATTKSTKRARKN